MGTSRFNFNALIFKDIYVIFATKTKLEKDMLKYRVALMKCWKKKRCEKSTEYSHPIRAGDDQL